MQAVISYKTTKQGNPPICPDSLYSRQVKSPSESTVSYVHLIA